MTRSGSATAASWSMNSAANRCCASAASTARRGHLILGGLEGPVGLAAGPNGSVYLTEAFSGQVSKVEANGERTVVAKDLKMPEGIAVAPDGNLVVAEVGARRIILDRSAKGNGHGGRRQFADRASGGTRRLADQHPDRRGHRRNGHDLLLVRRGERHLQGEQEVRPRNRGYPTGRLVPSNFVRSRGTASTAVGLIPRETSNGGCHGELDERKTV